MWAAKLGDSALHGIKKVFRQAWISGNYRYTVTFIISLPEKLSRV